MTAACRSRSSVTSMPPSPVVSVFEPWKLKVDATPKSRPGAAYSEPMASAASSISGDAGSSHTAASSS